MRKRKSFRNPAVFFFLLVNVGALAYLASIVGTKIKETRIFASGKTYYVSTTGSDSNSGTSTSYPFKTIQKAADVAAAGDIVQIRGGTYYQKFAPVNSGNSTQGYITFTAYPGESVTLEGSGISLSSPNGLVDVVGKSYIKIQNLTIKNASYFAISVRSNSSSVKPAYIEVSGMNIYDTYDTAIKLYQAQNITIKNNNIERVKRSSGIGAWSSDRVTITNNKIKNAHIYNQSQGGHEESLSIASTTNFEVSYNEISMSGYQGYLGNEGIDIKESSRYGKVHHNYIHDFNPEGGGLYLDAWKAGLNGTPTLSNIEVYNNTLKNAAGITTGSEQGGTTENVNVYNNVIYNTGAVGIGIPKRTPSDSAVPEGMKRNINIYNNTIYKARWNGGAGIYITSTRIGNINIKNNIVHFNNYNGLITAGSSASLPNIAANNNIVYGPKYCAQDYPNCVEISNNPSGYPLIHSNRTVDPQFVNLSTVDLHLKSTSPAIDKGLDLRPLITSDLDGKTRPQGTAFDVGAYEYGVSSTPTNSPTPKPTSTPTITPTPSPPSSSTNMIINGSFNNGTNYWGLSLNNASATLRSTSSTGSTPPVLDIAMPSGNPTASSTVYIILYQSGMKVESGKKYLLSFQARATASRSINIRIQNSVSPWNYLTGSVTRTISTSWTKYDIPLTATASGTGDLKIDVGTSQGDIYLDNVSLVPVVINGYYEGESSINTLAGKVIVQDCSGCSEKKLAGYVGNGSANYLQFNQVYAPVSGKYNLDVYYVMGSSGTRDAYMSVNGGTKINSSYGYSGGWAIPAVKTFQVNLISGNNTIRFGNDSAYAPSFDRIRVRDIISTAN